MIRNAREALSKIDAAIEALSSGGMSRASWEIVALEGVRRNLVEATYTPYRKGDVLRDVHGDKVVCIKAGVIRAS